MCSLLHLQLFSASGTSVTKLTLGKNICTEEIQYAYGYRAGETKKLPLVVYEIECKKCQDICLSIVNCVRTFIFDLPLFFLKHTLQHKCLIFGHFLFSASSLRTRVGQTCHDQPHSKF